MKDNNQRMLEELAKKSPQCFCPMCLNETLSQTIPHIGDEMRLVLEEIDTLQMQGKIGDTGPVFTETLTKRLAVIATNLWQVAAMAQTALWFSLSSHPVHNQPPHTKHAKGNG